MIAFLGVCTLFQSTEHLWSTKELNPTTSVAPERVPNLVLNRRCLNWRFVDAF